METVHQLLESKETYRHFISTLIFIAVLFGLRYFLIRTVRSWKFPSNEARRRVIFQIKNLFFIIFLIGLIVIWAQELRTFAISLVAVAAALVLGTKELILCFLGGIFKMSTKLFDIGDRIEVQGQRGDVIDHSLLSTTIQEIGPSNKLHQYTGRTVQIPNSLFLGNFVFNESSQSGYSLHTFPVTISIEDNWEAAEKVLKEAADQTCSEFLELAIRHTSKLADKEGIDTPNMKPRTSVVYSTPEEISIYVRVPVPNSRKGKIEQSIIRLFLQKKNQWKTEISPG